MLQTLHSQPGFTAKPEILFPNESTWSRPEAPSRELLPPALQ
jgi:hypothetical protein